MAEISGVQHQRRRAIYNQLLTFVGSVGELAADMTNFRLSVADGSTPGGWFSSRRNSVNAGDTAYVIKTTDASVLAQLTTNRTLTLPSAQSYAAGQKLIVADVLGHGIGNLAVQTSSTTEKIFVQGGFAPSTLFNLFANTYRGLALIAVAPSSAWIGLWM